MTRKKDSQAVRTLFIIAVGTTDIEGRLLSFFNPGSDEKVPTRFIAIDSISYEQMKRRMMQNGWSEEQVEQAIPQSHFFYLESPFGEGFDWINPLNEQWAKFMPDPGARRKAADPNGSGAVPMVAAAKFRYNWTALSTFIEKHVQELISARPETFGLMPGLIVFVLTTFRGATGTAGALCVGRILRSVLNGGEIHLRASMPCVYEGDIQTFANAWAALVECFAAHREGAGPFDTVVPIFNNNGQQGLRAVDVLQYKLAAIMAYARPGTQAALLTRRVDLNTQQCDHEGNPTNIATEAAITISVLPPGVVDYQVASYIAQDVDAVKTRLEDYFQNGRLLPQEEKWIQSKMIEIISELGFSADGLMARVENHASALMAVRGFLEGARPTFLEADSESVAKIGNEIAGRIHEIFGRVQPMWSQQAEELRRQWPALLAAKVREKAPGRPVCELELLKRLRQHVTQVGADIRVQVEKAGGTRAVAGKEFDEQLKSCARRKFFPPWDRSWSEMRDKALRKVLEAAMAREHQVKAEAVSRVLMGANLPFDIDNLEMTSTLSDVLEEGYTERTAEIQRIVPERWRAAQKRRAEKANAIQKCSTVFHHCLLHQGQSVADLDRAVRGMLRDEFAAAREFAIDPSVDLIELEARIRPLLSTNAESTLSMMDVFSREPETLITMIERLRNFKAYTPLKREVEDQYGLRNRRDTIRIVEVPGGQDGPLAGIFLSERVVEERNQIVDSGTEEIRWYEIRMGLPYPVLALLEKYRRRFEGYMDSVSAITPFTTNEPHKLPEIVMPELAIQDYCLRLLALARFVTPDICHKNSSTSEFHLTLPAEDGSTQSRILVFQSADDAKRFLIRDADARRYLKAASKSALEDNAGLYIKRLKSALKVAQGAEREFLEREFQRHAAGNLVLVRGLTKLKTKTASF